MKLSVVIVAFLILSCGQKAVKEEIEPNVHWKSDMHKLANSLSKLLPLAVSSAKFHEDRNKGLIQKELGEMRDVSKRIEKSAHATQSDPIIKFTARKFSEDIDYAYEQFKIGNSDFAQTHIRNSTRYCMGCHTRNDQGQEFSWNWGVDFNNFKPIDKAQFLTSIRDFDKALATYKEILNDKKTAVKDPGFWIESAKMSMAISVRVKRDPKLALSILNTVIQQKTMPPSMQQTLLQWQVALKDWSREKKVTLDFKQTLSRANELLQKGWQSTQFPQSIAGSIYFLRASTLLHDLLEQKLKSEERAQVLYSSGLVAEKLKDINLWTLHEAYYEACIHSAPRTQLAKKCYLRFEAVVISNYMASPYNGLVPVHVRHHLDSLRKTAEMGDWNELLNWELVE